MHSLRRAAPGLARRSTAVDWHKLGQIGAYFAYAGSFVFGSGLAIVPFLYGGVVQEYHWLTDRQFVDAVAVAMITPGPVVITTGFIGYLVAGFWGAVVAALGTFVPCYLLHHPAGAVLQEARQAPGHRRLRRRRDGRGDRRDRRRRDRHRPALDHRLGHRRIWRSSPSALLWRFKKLPEPVDRGGRRPDRPRRPSLVTHT